MQKNKPISLVFNYTTPISLSQTAQRSFVDRLELKKKLSNEVLRDGVLIVSGYSSIGKTSLINIVTDKKHLQSVGAPYTATILILLNSSINGQILKSIHDEIFEFTSGRKAEAITPTSLANIIHTNRLLVIIDGINNLYNQPTHSKELYSLCKAWTDIPRGGSTQSKMILVASGLSDLVDKWVSQNGSSARLPYEHILLPAWSLIDLMKIIEIGSQYTGTVFDDTIQHLMGRVSCGLPSTMTLLAHIIARHANNDQDTIQQEKLKVELSDLYGVFGESRRFEQVLYRNEKLNAISTPTHIALYIIGIHGGRLSETSLNKLLEDYGFGNPNVLNELYDLVTLSQSGEEVYFNINELSYGTFAFLHLYHRTKLAVSDAQSISQALSHLNNVADINLPKRSVDENAVGISISTERNKGMFSPEQVAWIILQKAFSFIADELKQRWELAREKKKDNNQQNQPAQNGVSQQLQNTLNARLRNSQDDVHLRAMIDDLDTSIKMAENYNRLRNKYRQQLPLALDNARIELQVEEAEAKRDHAITEIKYIFEKIAKEEIVTNNNKL
jgi:hypothetical protein